MVTALWRRLDSPGHDACRLLSTGDGWKLDGTAVFRFESSPACVRYEVSCDAGWRSQHGRVHGWVGSRMIDFEIVRAESGQWNVNENVVPGMDHCIDLDFGFTPATNAIQLRRLRLAQGEDADVPVAWLDVPDGRLQVLQQRYERRSERTYWYEAPAAGYPAPWHPPAPAGGGKRLLATGRNEQPRVSSSGRSRQF